MAATALRSLVEQNVEQARASLAGWAADERLQKAAFPPNLRPEPPQLDHPQGLSATPPVLQAAAADMQEGIDAISPVQLNDLYQRYDPNSFHKAMSRVAPEHLHHHAAKPGLHPHVKHALLAAAAVQKAFSGSKPAPAGPPQYPDSSPAVSIPANQGRPLNNDGLQANWRAQAPAVPRAAGFNEPGTWILQSNPGPGGSPNHAVGNQWVFQPANGDPVVFPVDHDAVGVGDTDDEGYVNRVGQPNAGDLVTFRGPGDSSFNSRTVMLVTGHAIGEFDGQTIIYPTDAIVGHRIGGADHATDDSTPEDLREDGGGSGVGLGAKRDGAEFGVQKSFKALQAHLEAQGHSSDSAARIAAFVGRKKYGKKRMARAAAKGVPAKRIKKAAHDPYYGGTPGALGAGEVHPPLENPDDGAPLTPYTDGPPYDPDGTDRDTGPGTRVQGSMTPKEYALIDRVVSHRGPMPTESAALKALRTGEADEQHREVLRKAIRAYGFAVPALKAAGRDIIQKLS